MIAYPLSPRRIRVPGGYVYPPSLETVNQISRSVVATEKAHYREWPKSEINPTLASPPFVHEGFRIDYERDSIMGSVEPMTPDTAPTVENPPTSLITEVDGERQDWVNLTLYKKQVANVDAARLEIMELERKLQLHDGDFSAGLTVGTILTTLVIGALYGIKQLFFYTPPDITGW